MLHQLREEEQIMESMVVALGPAANSTSAGELDATVPLQCPNSAAITAAAHWSRLGAKPRALFNFTPAPRPRREESWTDVRKSKHHGKPKHSSPPSQPLPLSNTFSILDEDYFPPLKNHYSPSPSKPAPSSHSHRQKLLNETVPKSSGIPPRSEPVSVTSPDTAAAASSANPVRPHSTSSSHNADPHSTLTGNVNQQLSSPRPLFSPTTLIVGDSIIRNVRFFNAATHCFPGSTVPVLLEKLPALLHSLPSSIKRVLVHIGSNDSARRQSELIKNDFMDLLNFLTSSGKSVFISGPIPTVARGADSFSRILSLNTWLQSTCSTHNINFIDNFNLFWNRSLLFKADGLHPNRNGSRMLAANLQHAVQTATRA